MSTAEISIVQHTACRCTVCGYVDSFQSDALDADDRVQGYCDRCRVIQGFEKALPKPQPEEPVRECACCGSKVSLWYGKQQNKFAVNGLHGCKWCWIQGWYPAREDAWKSFETVQSEYKTQNDRLEPPAERDSA